MSSNRAVILAHVGLFLAAAFYAGNFTIAKLVMPAHVQPFAFIVLRVVAAAILFFLTHLLFVRQKIERQDIGRLLLCALTGVAANQLMFFKGLSLTTPIHGALIMLTTPILVLIAATLMLGERVSWQKITGVIIGLSGASLLVWSNQQPTSYAANPVLGDIFVGLNAVSYSIYLILVKPLMQKYSPITVLLWVFGLGTFMVVPVGAYEVAQIDFAAFTWDIWLAIAYILFCVTFLTYLFNTAALRIISPSVVSAYIYLQPLLTAIIALFTRQDSVNGALIASGGLIFVGVYLSSRK
jgi:drug/metabolite transporter (DMT)-like permease